MSGAQSEIGVTLDDSGGYLMPCVRCGVARRILWHGPAAYRLAATVPCRSCVGRASRNLAHAPGKPPPPPDPFVVDLIVTGGYRMRVLKSERKLAYQELTRRNPEWPGWRLADRLRVTVRTVERYRAELRAEQRAA